MNFQTVPLNLIEELQLRRWARLNYLPQPERSPDCHPVILEELSRMDEEGVAFSPDAGGAAWAGPCCGRMMHTS